MKTLTDDRRAWRFFLDNAAYSMPPGRVACAAQLAQAEAEASARGWEVRWSYDLDSGDDALGDHASWCRQDRKREPHEHELWLAKLEDMDGHPLAVVRGIIDPDHAYRREVAAELALEALAASR